MKRFGFVFGLLPLLCIAVGVMVAWALESGSLRDWELLGTPPGGAGEFVDANATSVYLKNNDGVLYRCPKCWEEVQPLEKPLLDPTRNCPGGNVRVPPPPGEVVDRLAKKECYADASSEFEYVILSDGSVWKWSFFSGVYGLLVYPLFAFCGCLFGITPLVISIFIGKFKRNVSGVPQE